MSQHVVADSPARLFQLETLYEISRECAELDSPQDVLHVLLSSVMGAFGAVRGVALLGDASGRLEAVDVRGFSNPHGADVSQDLLAQVTRYLTAGTERDARRHGDVWVHAAGMDAWAAIEVEPVWRGIVAL